MENSQDAVAIALRYRLSNENSSILSLSNEEVNDVTEQRPGIINTIRDSSDVNINNTNNNYYNAPVVIHHIYPNTDKVDKEFVEDTSGSLPSESHTFFYHKVAKWSSKRWKIAVVLLVLAISILLIALIIWTLTTTKNFQGSHDINLLQNDSETFRMQIVTRDEWGAKPPRGQTDLLKTVPPPYVIISHTETVLCYTEAQCIVRRIQTEHMKPWYDIAYNFLVGGDGLIYEGRGWDIEGAHTIRYNRMSIGISFIGTFKTEPPTKLQLLATEKLIEYGVARGHIAADYKLFGHRQVYDSDSPGAALFNIIKRWKHWTPIPCNTMTNTC